MPKCGRFRRTADGSDTLREGFRKWETGIDSYDSIIPNGDNIIVFL